MKILFFIEDLRAGGKERRLVELLKRLSQVPNISIVLVLTRKEIHYDEIFDLGIRIHYVERKFLKKDPRVFIKFFRIANKLKPDIIHVWGNVVAVFSIPSKMILRIPLINNQISDAPVKLNNSFLHHRLTFPFSDQIIANSYAGLKAYGVDKSKGIVIYNGFDFRRIQNLPCKKTVLKNLNITTKYVVGMVASYSDLKDYETYIKASNIVNGKFSDVTFICVGEGDSDPYEKLVHPQFKNNVVFLGRRKDVEQIMSICDIGVLCTYSEGISNALMEFSSLGKPIVSNFGGGTNELVLNEKTGYLVDPKSPEQVAEKILFLLLNERVRNNFGEEARRHVRDKFDIEKMVFEFRKIYSKIDLEHNKRIR